MRRYGLGWVALGAFIFQGSSAMAQSSLEALEQDLKEAKQQHQDASSQLMANFFSQVDAAMASPDAALALYKQAGGTMPVLTPVVTQHESETVSEKEARLAVDQANLSIFGAALQLHCGMMHYAALFVVKPDQKGLHDEWVAWLQKVAQTYPQIYLPDGDDAPAPGQHRKKRDGAASGAPNPPPFNLADLKGKSMRESIIGKFLGFKVWNDKDQGGWSVGDLPKFYRANVLEPLRKTPTSATLAAWDSYITMAHTDEKDENRWNQTVYPPLQFDRACDDYTVAPGTEKLEGLVGLIKANPTYPQVEDWISRVHQLLDDYRTNHGGKAPAVQNPAPAPSTPTGGPNVTVTTSQQGDMTIVTTHTNSTANPAAPTH